MKALAVSCLSFALTLVLTGCAGRSKKQWWESFEAAHLDSWGKSGIIGVKAEDLIHAVGQPDSMHTAKGHTYWIYTCKDGTICIDMNSLMLERDGKINATISDEAPPKTSPARTP